MLDIFVFDFRSGGLKALAVELEEELRAVIVRRKKLAFLADEEAAAARDFPWIAILVLLFGVEGADVPQYIVVGFTTAIEPCERERGHAFAGGKFKADFGTFRIGFLV